MTFEQWQNGELPPSEGGSSSNSGKLENWQNGELPPMAGGIAAPSPDPSGLTATTISQTQIDLSWTDNSSDETGFKVEWSPTGAGSWTLITTTAANATSYSHTSLTANTTYYYRVSATNAGGDSGYTTANATTLPNAPTAPSSLTATAASATQINLAWTDNSSNETGFEVERSANGTTGWSNITTTAANATSYNSTGLTEATTYYYRVRAVNAGGNSSYTSAASALTYPAAPTSLDAVQAGSTQNDLTWTDNSAGETGFHIERSATGAGGWSVIGTNSANDTTYSDTGLSPGATWYYRVAAYNATGDSAYSNTDNATTLAPPVGAPSGLTATAVSASQINLAWTDGTTGETGFEVERSPNGSSSWTLITTTAANATSYNNTTGLSEATTYYYRVRGVNADGATSYTSTASALTFPAAPSSLVAFAPDDTEIDLTWTDNSAGETGQKVERSANGTTGWTLITTAAANATSYDNTGLTPGATWYYRIGAYNASGTSYSNVDSATTAAAPQLIYDIAIRVSFDWDRDTSYTNETAYVISAKGSQRVAPASQSITANQGQVAQCSIVLDNSTGRFSSLNSGGALYAYIGEGKAYQVPVDVEISVVPAGDAAAYTSVFQGFARIPSEATLAPGQAKTITFDCRSKEDILMNKKLRTSQADFKAYRDSGVTEAEFIADLVAEAAPDLTLVADDGLVMLPWAYLENESVLETIWQLCAATGGRFYGSADGTVNYENAAHWLYDPHDTSQYSYTRGSGFQSLELSWNDTEIAEEASVSWTEKEISQPDVIYDSDRIVVPAGETVTIYGDFNAPAYEITGIVTTAGTNGGVDLSADIAVTPTYYAQSVKLEIVSTSAVQANVRVKVSGKIAEDTDSQTVSNTSGDSFWTDRVGRTRKVTGNRWVQSEGQANMLLDFIRNRQVLPTLVAKMKGCPGINYRKIGDRVTITDSEINLNSTAFWVTAINWTYSSRGYWQDLECVRCSDLYPYESTTPGYFIWGTSKWGSSDPARGRLFF